MPTFHADCRSILIGSLPLTDHNEAFDWVLAATPDIPLWVQLPAFAEEGMIPQFASGMPGLVKEADRMFVDAGGAGFEAELLSFYEGYMAVSETGEGLDDESRFALDRSVAMGFHVFMEKWQTTGISPAAIKGQITGPITFGTGLHDREGRAIFYDLHARDAAVKLLAMKARWQVRRLQSLGAPVMLFVDEPALAGYGSSEFISISRDEIIAAIGEVIEAVHEEGAFAGVHVCANTDWSMILESGTDIVNFDAYTYFDRFVLYPDAIRAFVDKGGTIAWGIVPTGHAEDIDRASTESLITLWDERLDGMGSLGFSRERLLAQSLVTPSCGAGSLNRVRARKVIELTRDLSRRIRAENGIGQGH